MRLTFYGGAEKVTGSNFLVEEGQGRVLIDCGLEQGHDFSEKEMYAPFPYNPKDIHALVVTHAHLDHVGRIPKLVKEGFSGVIYMTPPTRELTELILRDSQKILSKNAEERGLPPLYEEPDVDEALRRIKLLEYHREQEVAPGLSACLRMTGHILGSASVRLAGSGGASLALTSDIGNTPNPLLPDPEPISDANVLVAESVYGNRLHRGIEHRLEHLRAVLARAIAKGGTILMPAFSIERTQLMLYEIGKLFEAGALPRIPVYLDSPLAIAVTDVYKKYEKELLNFDFVIKTPSRSASERIREVEGAKLIIAGAGMSHGGRIGKWQRAYLPLASTTLIIVGYQAPGSPGRRLSEGQKSVRIEGEEVKVAAEVVVLSEWSGHADRDGLLNFIHACKEGNPRLHTVFTAMGEPAAQRFLAQRVHDYLGLTAYTALPGASWEIGKGSVQRG